MNHLINQSIRNTIQPPKRLTEAQAEYRATKLTNELMERYRAKTASNGS